MSLDGGVQMLSGLLCQAHVKERRRPGMRRGDGELLARRADDGDQIDQLLVRDCVS